MRPDDAEITEDEPESTDPLRAILEIAAVAVVAAIVLWLAKGGGTSQIQSLFSPPTTTVTAAGTSGPAPSPGCASDQLELIGSLTGCAKAVVQTRPDCATTVGDSLDVLVIMRNGQHLYRLFIAVDGGYHGPGLYVLAPWPHDYLGAHDGAAKVALREDATGASWQSSAGSLTVGDGARVGSVLAALNFAGGAPTPRVSRLDFGGPWSC
jgi:hypothetical protein